MTFDDERFELYKRHNIKVEKFLIKLFFEGFRIKDLVLHPKIEDRGNTSFLVTEIWDKRSQRFLTPGTYKQKLLTE